MTLSTAPARQATRCESTGLTHHLATAIWQARFSPDGRFLLLAHSAGPVSIQVHTVTITVMDIRTGRR